MNAFLAELRRRKVIRVAAAYLVAAWLIMQVVNVAAPAMDMPGWVDGFILLLLAAGFVVAVVMSWVFELTAEGLKRTSPATAAAPPGTVTLSELIMVGAVVLIAGASLVQVVRPRPQAVADRSGAVDDLSIAVLPFADMSPEGDQEYFSDGLSEELLNVLAQIEELRVAGRTSSFAFKGRNDDLRVIAQQLGVANILEGSVRKSGDQLRITAQLVSASDGYHLWSATYDRRLDDVFAVQEEIATAVAEALSVTLGVEAIDQPAPQPESETYDLYLRGLALVRGPRESADFLRAADIFRGVLALDPAFGRARVALAEAYIPIAVLYPERREQTIGELEAVVSDALARAPDDPSSHYASAILHLERQEWLEADAAFARAEAGGVVGQSAYSAMVVFGAGRVTDAIDRFAAAVRTDPLAADPTNMLQQALTAARRFDEAEAEYDRSLAVGIRLAPIEHMAVLRAQLGSDEALIRERFDRYLETQSVSTPLNAAVREVYDDPAAVRALLRDAVDQPDMQDPTRQLFLAIYAAQYGDPELAVAALRRTLVDMKGTFTQALWYPDMAEARRTPAFKNLVRDLGLVDYWRATGNWSDFCRPVGADDFECS